MSNCNVMINGEEYAPINKSGASKHIVMLDSRGLMFVGDIDWSVEGDRIPMYNARCIIRWGTTKHIAELADGPTSNTKLGASQTIHINRLAVTMDMKVSDDGWSNE